MINKTNSQIISNNIRYMLGNILAKLLLVVVFVVIVKTQTSHYLYPIIVGVTFSLLVAPSIIYSLVNIIRFKSAKQCYTHGKQALVNVTLKKRFFNSGRRDHFPYYISIKHPEVSSKKKMLVYYNWFVFNIPGVIKELNFTQIPVFIHNGNFAIDYEELSKHLDN